MLYKMAERSSNRLMSLIIQNVNLENIAEFEATFIDVVAEFKATQMLRRDMSTMLAHASSTTNSLLMLNLHSHVDNVSNSLQSVNIASKNGTYTRNFITSVLLLHYKTLPGPDQEEGLPKTTFSTPMRESAEIAVHYADDEDQEPGDVSRSIIEIKHSTHITHDAVRATVTVVRVPCHGYHEDERLLSIDETDVTFSFTNKRDAKNCADHLEEMRMELFTWRLQNPQSDEIVALHLQTARVYSEDFSLPDAEIFILRRPNAIFRLLIKSRNRCTTFSQVLADDFFTTPGKPANFQTPAWRVQLEDGGKREIYKYERGLSFLKFSTDEAEQMFQLGRGALSGTIPIRVIGGSSS